MITTFAVYESSIRFIINAAQDLDNIEVLDFEDTNILTNGERVKRITIKHKTPQDLFYLGSLQAHDRATNDINKLNP